MQDQHPVASASPQPACVSLLNQTLGGFIEALDPGKGGRVMDFSEGPERRQLVELLCSLMSSKELRRFVLEGNRGRDIDNSIPSNEAAKDFANDVVEKTFQRGCLTDEWFERLIKERPEREADIRALWRKPGPVPKDAEVRTTGGKPNQRELSEPNPQAVVCLDVHQTCFEQWLSRPGYRRAFIRWFNTRSSSKLDTNASIEQIVAAWRRNDELAAFLHTARLFADRILCRDKANELTPAQARETVYRLLLSLIPLHPQAPTGADTLSIEVDEAKRVGGPLQLALRAGPVQAAADGP
ncbi:MAG: hypothetical protein AAFV29_25225, partial [Myxococcota bacterium]